MNILKSIILGLSLTLVTACGTITHTTSQAEEAAYIVVKGNMTNKSYSVNNSTPVAFPESKMDIVRVQVPLGNVLFQVYEADKLILNRKLFLSNNDNREVTLP
ncbi:hypothetical protein N9W11_01225 [Psychrosphaera haliotis]|nr:hypothetical protein [Psychrosphaera haliotis]